MNLQTFNEILLIVMAASNLCWWLRYLRTKKKYLYYKKIIMVHYYGGKTDLMREAAKLHDVEIIDIKLTKDINNGT